MSKISQILKESTIPQITGKLAIFDLGTENLIGKCAMGVLSCESGNPKFIIHNNDTMIDVPNILKEYDIPEDLQTEVPTFAFDDIGQFDINYGSNDISYLFSEIVFLNDSMKLTFKEIAEFLEVTYDL